MQRRSFNGFNRKQEIASDRTLDEAERFLDQALLPTALAKLKLYLADPRVTKKHEAQKLMNEIEAAISPEAALSILVGLSDAEYQRFRQDKQLQDGKVTHPGLAKKGNANLISALPNASVMREEIKRKGNDERLARLEAEKRAQEERDRLARLKREEQEEERRKELVSPIDGTDDFGRIAEFYEKHVGKKYYFKGLYHPVVFSRDRDRKLFSVPFANKSGTVSGGPHRDRLSFIATEAMAEKLLDVRKGGEFHAIVYVKIKYLDDSAKQYPVGYITKVEFTELDLDVVNEYVRVTITDDGNATVHENPFKKK